MAHLPLSIFEGFSMHWSDRSTVYTGTRRRRSHCRGQWGAAPADRDWDKTYSGKRWFVSAPRAPLQLVTSDSVIDGPTTPPLNSNHLRHQPQVLSATSSPPPLHPCLRSHQAASFTAEGPALSVSEPADSFEPGALDSKHSHAALSSGLSLSFGAGACDYPRTPRRGLLPSSSAGPRLGRLWPLRRTRRSAFAGTWLVSHLEW